MHQQLYHPFLNHHPSTVSCLIAILQWKWLFTFSMCALGNVLDDTCFLGILFKPVFSRKELTSGRSIKSKSKVKGLGLQFEYTSTCTLKYSTCS